VLGVVAIDLDPADGNGGLFHTSWDGNFAPEGRLGLDATFRHRDNVVIGLPGFYALYVSMCFSPFKDCRGGGDWENVSGPVVVSVQ